MALNAWCFEPDGSFNITAARAAGGRLREPRGPCPTLERAALPVLAHGAAMRFFLTRLHDWGATPAGALVRPKDPLEYERKLAVHRAGAATWCCSARPRDAAGGDLHRRRLLAAIRARAAGARCCIVRRAARRSSGAASWPTTNNRMELMAAIQALEALKQALPGRAAHRQPVRAERHHRVDPRLEGARLATADKKPVKNDDLWKRLDAARAAPRGRLALGQGPRRPRVQRARRRAGAARPGRDPGGERQIVRYRT